MLGCAHLDKSQITFIFQRLYHFRKININLYVKFNKKVYSFPNEGVQLEDYKKTNNIRIHRKSFKIKRDFLQTVFRISIVFNFFMLYKYFPSKILFIL